MRRKIIFLTILLLLTANSNGQTSEVERDTKNPFFEYKSRIYDPILSDHVSTGVLIDTLNVCRIKQSKIKRLKIYYFKSLSDSTLWTSYQYDTNGFISNMTPIIGWYSLSKDYVHSVNINCDTYKHEVPKKKKKEYHFLDRYKETFEYDNLEYLTKYSDVKLGIINRWFTRVLGGGTIKYITFYRYNEDYSAVDVSHCYKSRILSKKCTPLYYDILTCVFDKNGNLLTEMKYKFDKNGEAMVVEGFKYIYDYFE
jgi:hypothetical protein